jgi:hypothetical protein
MVATEIGKGSRTQILAIEHQEVEGVQNRVAPLTRRPERSGVRQAVSVMRHGLAIEHRLVQGQARMPRSSHKPAATTDGPGCPSYER